MPLLEMLPGIGYTGCDLSSSQVPVARWLNPAAPILELSCEDKDFPGGDFGRILFLETLGARDTPVRARPGSFRAG